MKKALFVLLFYIAASCKPDPRTANFPKLIEQVKDIPKKGNVWVFVMAGQSNMAGRGLVEPQDTLPDKRILTVNQDGQLIYAKEPIHWYEPKNTGLDCGMSFARTLLKSLPDSISILLIPCAVGGSSISQWIGDDTYRGVKLLSNFKAQVGFAKKYGKIKGILWHQGEAEGSDDDIVQYKARLGLLFSQFRKETGNGNLPIILGEIGTFKGPQKLNQVILAYSKIDHNSAVVSAEGLRDKGDNVHFNSEGLRLMGARMASQKLISITGN